MLKKIPIIGGLLSSMAGFLPHSLAGAISVEPVMAITKLLAGYLPAVPASLVYAISGALLASGVGMLPFFAAATKAKLAIAVASAAGGVGYYKMRTGMDAPADNEAAVLEMSGAGFGGLIRRGQFAGLGLPGSSYSGVVRMPQYAGANYRLLPRG